MDTLADEKKPLIFVAYDNYCAFCRTVGTTPMTIADWSKSNGRGWALSANGIDLRDKRRARLRDDRD